MASAGSKIDCLRAATLHQKRYCGYVRISQIRYVNVIAYSGTVLRRVIIAKNGQRRSAACSRLKCERNEMSLRVMQFTGLTVRIGTGCIEIAQGNPPYAMGLFGPMQEPLADQFCLAIGADRVCGHAFMNRNRLRQTVSGTAR